MLVDINEMSTFKGTYVVMSGCRKKNILHINHYLR